jgi:hypothetical protein
MESIVRNAAAMKSTSKTTYGIATDATMNGDPSAL